MRAHRLLLLLVVLLLLPAGTASAAAITLSDDPEAESPGIAVDASGTGHVAWVVSRSGTGAAGADDIVYCRLPRGASACDRTQLLTPDALESFSAPTVIDRGDGRIEVIASRCCNERTWAVVSTDGGATFAPPKEIGTLSSDVGAPGPGADTVGLTDDSLDGARFQFAPIDAPGPRTTAAALLGAGEFWYARGTALVDSTTPLAVFSDLGSVGYRAFDPTRGPDYNDPANWGPPKEIPDLIESQVTSGLSGTFLLGIRPPALGQAVEVRRYDPGTGAFGDPVDLTRGANEAPIFPSLFEDADGGVHATWVRNGRAPGGEDQLRHAFSADGITWTAPETIDVEAGYSFRTGAAGDHGGWVVSDQNSGGPIEAAVIPVGGATPVPTPPPVPTTSTTPGPPPVPGTPPPPGDPALGSGPPTAPATACNVVKITTKVEARAQGGCFEDAGNGRKRTTADVRLNGLDFLTPGADATVTIDPAANRVLTAGDVVQKAGSVVLHRGAVSWDLDGTTTFDDLTGEGINLLGLPVRGKATVRFGQLSTDVTLNLLLPDPFSDVTGATTLRTTQAQGLRVDGVRISVAEASVGLLTIQQLDLTFSSGFSTFEGKGKFLLPPNDATLEVGFGIEDGKFAHAEIPYYDGPPLPVPLATSITLQAIGFGVSVADGFRLDGRVVVGAGSLGGAAPITVDGDVSFAIPKGGGTAVLTAGGKLRLVSLQLATAQAKLTTAGLFTFSGAARFAGLDATVAGGVDLQSGSFYASGEVQICVLVGCASGALIVSSVGLYGCASVSALGVSVYAGVGIVWPADPELAAGTGGCDVDDFVPAALRAAPGPRQASGALSVPVEGGSEQVALRVKGAGGALPAIAVVAPGGATVATDPADPAKATAGKGVLLLPDARTGTVQVVAQRPPAGAFTVTPTGGAAIAGIDAATGPKPPTVRARVLGRGRDRTIRWTVADRSPGTTVRFVERSAGGIAHVLPRVTGARGTQRLRVADGPAGRRTIEALVERGGTPRRGSGTVASFVAPGPATPGRVRVRARRSGAALVVRWTRSRDAARHRISVTTGDGRLLQLRRSARTRSLRLPLAAGDAARVTVRGESASYRLGPVASARVAARRR